MRVSILDNTGDIASRHHRRPTPAVPTVTAAVSRADLPSPQALAALIVAVGRERDRQAFAALFRHFAPRIKSFLMRRGADATLADELVQETMLTVWRRADSYDPALAGASTWLFTIARNAGIDRQRQDVRRIRLAADLGREADETVTDGAEIGVLTAEREALVRRALATLSPEQATVVRLSFFAEAPQSAIAAELGIPLGTVKSRVRLALQRLKTMLEAAR